MDEVARAEAAHAHRRLDGYNGQISRLATELGETRRGLYDELDRTREGIYTEIGVVRDQMLSPLTKDVAGMKTALKIGGTIALAVLTATLSATVILLTRINHAPQQPTPRKASYTTPVAQHDRSVAEGTGRP